MEEEVDIYTPPIKEQIPLSVDADNSGFEDIMEGGIIKTKLNEDVIIHRIAKDLYKNPFSGVRELFNNSVRACKLAEKKYGQEDSLITITVDYHKHSISIADNGIGISKEVFKKVLRELGVSNNHDGTEIGQFGMGFASYTTLSSVITLDTHARNGDRYKLLAKDGMSFQPIGDSTQEKYGTTLEMVCYPKIDLRGLLIKIADMMMFSGVPSILKRVGFENENLEQKFERLTFVEYAYEQHKEERIIHINNDDFELIAVTGKWDYNNNENSIFLLNSPIMADIDNPGFSDFFLNIKNERKFPPMPDRDRMREESEKMLDKLISDALEEYFSTLNIHNYDELLKSDRKLQFIWLCQMKQAWLPKDVDGALMASLRDVRVYTLGEKTRNAIPFFNHLESHLKMVWLQNSNRAVVLKIKELGYDIITVTKGTYEDWETNINHIKAFGIPEAKEFLKSRKETIPKLKKIKKKWNLSCYSEMEEHDIHQRKITEKEINMNVICLDSIPVADFKKILSPCRTNHIFVRNDSCLKGKEYRKYSEWSENEVPHLTFSTSRGMMTVEDIAEWMKDSGKKCVVVNFSALAYASTISKMDGLYIMDVNATLPLKVYYPEIRFDFISLTSLMRQDTEHRMASKLLANMLDTCHIISIDKTTSKYYDDLYSFRLSTRDKHIKFMDCIPNLKLNVKFSHISINNKDSRLSIIDGVMELC